MQIIRGLALGLALIMYGREENAETLIEQMARDQDPIIRFGAIDPLRPLDKTVHQSLISIYSLDEERTLSFCSPSLWKIKSNFSQT